MPVRLENEPWPNHAAIPTASLRPVRSAATKMVPLPQKGSSIARALELDPAYVDVGVRRWQTYTGKAAVLAASGETFETIEEQRAGEPAAA